jgi:hypothetical protein
MRLHSVGPGNTAAADDDNDDDDDDDDDDNDDDDDDDDNDDDDWVAAERAVEERAVEAGAVEAGAARRRRRQTVQASAIRSSPPLAFLCVGVGGGGGGFGGFGGRSCHWFRRWGAGALPPANPQPEGRARVASQGSTDRKLGGRR